MRTPAIRATLGIPVFVLALGVIACSRPASPQPPQPLRVVSLTPSLTEIVAALGAIDLLVGVDKFSVIPAVQHLPQVGDFLSPNLEAIVALAPDIVLLDSVQTHAIEGLKAAKIRFLAVPIQNVDDVRAALRNVGTAVGREAAAAREILRLDRDLTNQAARAERHAAQGGKRPRVLFIVDRRPGGLSGMIAAGPGSYIDELLRRAGVDNVLADSSVRYVQISAEEVLQRAPDIILDAIHDANPERARADWASLSSVPAVANSRVYILGSPIYVTPGPKLDQALQGLIDRIWGDAR